MHFQRDRLGLSGPLDESFLLICKNIILGLCFTLGVGGVWKKRIFKK